MRRKFYPLLITTAALVGVAMSGFGLIRDDPIYYVLAVLFGMLSLMIHMHGQIARLTSDWPPGVIYGVGADHEWKRRKRHAKRGALELVPREPDDRIIDRYDGTFDDRFDDLL